MCSFAAAAVAVAADDDVIQFAYRAYRSRRKFLVYFLFERNGFLLLSTVHRAYITLLMLRETENE